MPPNEGVARTIGMKYQQQHKNDDVLPVQPDTG